MAFRGCVRIWTSAALSSSCSVPTTGSRPTNSGIRPYLIRSSGSTISSVVPMSRDVGDGAFENLEQRLLDPFPRHVARDRGVLVLAADFVDFVDVDDALL